MCTNVSKIPAARVVWFYTDAGEGERQLKSDENPHGSAMVMVKVWQHQLREDMDLETGCLMWLKRHVGLFIKM